MSVLRFFLLVFAPAATALANPDDFQNGTNALNNGRYAEAALLLGRAYEQLQRADPPRQMDADAAAIALVAAYQFQGRIADAERVLQPLVKRWQESKTPYLIAAVESLASVYSLKGKWPEAVQLAKESLVFARQEYGPDHRITRSAMANLAALHAQQNNLAEAADLLAEALVSARRANAGDAELLDILTGYGKIRIMQCDFEAAVVLLREAVALSAKFPGQDVASAEASYSLAAAYYHAGYPERSEPLVKAAIAKYEATAGPDSPALAGALMLQADLALLNHRLAAAEKLLKRTFDLLRNAFGTEDVEAAVVEARLGELALMSRNVEKAEPLIRHSLAVMQKTYHKPHPRLATAYSDLGALLANQGSYDEAERQYKSAIANFESIGYKGAPYIRTLESYGNILKRTNNKNEARQVLTRAKALSQSLLQQNVQLGY